MQSHAHANIIYLITVISLAFWLAAHHAHVVDLKPRHRHRPYV